MNHDTIDFLGRMWLWPPHDKHLRKVLPLVTDLDKAIERCSERRTAIQAGGACGVWPWYLSQHFASVWTFEAASDNYFYLNHNTMDRANIKPCMLALGADPGWAWMTRPSTEADNVGAYYTMQQKDREGGVRVATLDETIPPGSFVDLIQLDVEGSELQVLRGAARILTEDKPVVMLESKPLPQDEEMGNKPEEAILFLVNHGYEVVEQVHRDVIMTKRGEK